MYTVMTLGLIHVSLSHHTQDMSVHVPPDSTAMSPLSPTSRPILTATDPAQDRSAITNLAPNKKKMSANLPQSHTRQTNTYDSR
ncbi:hypothetical protein GDO81_007294 [Engystomops pustulosus]|uniref:CD45 n=1 Tax=Engystomops pustulosus TaxID=76066 RepID=A0AAV7C6A0_ENGPU|nr:hypothetical protein GDO81_007294 [Engystomops pustulosus]